MGQFISRQQQQAPAQGGPDNPEAAWWCKLLAKVVGAIGAVSE